LHRIIVMTTLERRKAPIGTRFNAADEQLLLDAAEVAGVSRHRLIRVAAVSLAKTVLSTTPPPSSV
jgi:uncharacterized protein (DUF1778 family)